MRVSAIIPYRNAAATLRRCVERLLSARRPPDELVLVDDASQDNGFDAVSELPGLIHIRNLEPLGAARARNLGARASSGDVLLFVDADVLVRPDALERAVAALEAEPGLAGVFGAYTREVEPENFATLYKNLVHHCTHLGSAGPIGTFWAGCGALRRAAFERVNGFDESYAAASVEDIDLGYRLAAAGLSVRLDPDIQATHVKRYTLASLVRSDFAGRAVPWTRLMVRRRRFAPELNLRPHNLVAAGLAALAPLLLLGLLAAGRPVWAIAVALLAAALWIGLNRRLLGLALRQGGPGFAARFALMHAFSHVYSVLGLATGLLSAALAAAGGYDAAPGRGDRPGIGS